MYTRVPSGQLPRGMRVPENYAGNAFRHLPAEEATPIDEPKETRETISPATEAAETLPVRNEEKKESADEPHVPVGGKPFPFSLRLPFFGSGQGKGLTIGTEELLLLGLILLISQEDGNSDLILLLILLLFIS